MTDILLQQTSDGGEVDIVGGLVALSPGLETSIYLSLFGGNEQDDGRRDNPLQFWGNRIEVAPVGQYRSETQHLLRSLPAVSGNLRRLEDAALRDLTWLISERVASSVSVSASIPAANAVRLDVNVNAEGEETSFAFVENWKQSA